MRYTARKDRSRNLIHDRQIDSRDKQHTTGKGPLTYGEKGRLYVVFLADVVLTSIRETAHCEGQSCSAGATPLYKDDR
jgi:hypothetical protein